MLKPEIKEEWIRRLRSGEYEQGKQYLNNDGRFCCLGVLCEMAFEAGIVTKQSSEEAPHSVIKYGDPKVGSMLPAVLPYEVRVWASADSKYPGISAVGDLKAGLTLAGLNDQESYDFNEIADVIEKEF